jgi:hypothetical protein
MNTTAEVAKYPFTVTQFRALNVEQHEAIEAVADYLSETCLPELADFTDQELSAIFNLLKPCDRCVPSEESGEELLNTIRKKFCAIYEIGLELAEKELDQKGFKDFSFCLVLEPSFEDATHIVILDYHKPICYLHEWIKAWHISYGTLADLANAVLQVKKQVIEKVIEFTKTEIFIVMEGGLVHEVVNLPLHINVTVIDYDTEGVEKERLEISPVDGELCTINKW